MPSEFLWGNSDLLWSARPAWDTRPVPPWFRCQEAPCLIPCCLYCLCRDMIGIWSAAWNGCWIKWWLRPENDEDYALVALAVRNSPQVQSLNAVLVKQALSSFADAKNSQLWSGCGRLLGCNIAAKNSSSKLIFSLLHTDSCISSLWHHIPIPLGYRQLGIAITTKELLLALHFEYFAK